MSEYKMTEIILPNHYYSPVSGEAKVVKPKRKYDLRNLYKDEFRDEDFQKYDDTVVNDTIVCSAIMPEDLNDTELHLAPAFSADDKLMALIYRVVAFSRKAKENLPNLQRGSILILMNMAGDSASPKMHYIMFESKDVRCVLKPEDLR